MNLVLSIYLDWDIAKIVIWESLFFVEKFMCIGLLAPPITLLETKIENI